MAAARAGSLAGYDGMQLEVRAVWAVCACVWRVSSGGKWGSSQPHTAACIRALGREAQPGPPALTSVSADSDAPPSPALPQVRSAGDEAWLCKPAPHVPELDGPEEGDDTPGDSVVTTLPALPDSAGAGNAAGGCDGSGGSAISRALAAVSHGSAKEAAVDPLVAWDYRQVAAAAAAARRRTSFRSVKEAVVRRMHCALLPAGCVFGHAACGWAAMQFSRVAEV